MRKLSLKSRSFLLRKSLKISFLARKRKKRALLYHLRRPKKRVKNKRPRINPIENWKYKKSKVATIPSVFSVESNIEEVLRFVNDIRDCVRNKVRIVRFDMRSVVHIDICAIVILLSLCKFLQRNRVSFIGNVPLDATCQQIFEESGFLSHMRTLSKQKKSFSTHYNLIMEDGNDLTNSKGTALCIQEAIKRLTGQERIGFYKAAQSIVSEISANSVEWAYRSKKHWIFCMNTTSDEVTFIVSDTGAGILNTLHRKHHQLIMDYFRMISKMSYNDIDVLKRAFEKKYSSSSREGNRNKGLPLIKRLYEEGKIKELKVITNFVSLDFDDETKSHSLSNEFKGTLYQFKIDKDIINNWLGTQYGN